MAAYSCNEGIWIDRFGHVIDHTRGQTYFSIIDQGMCGQSDDWQLRSDLPNAAGCLIGLAEAFEQKLTVLEKHIQSKS